AFGRPIAEYQAIQWMLADSAVEIEQVKWLVLNAAWKADQGGDARHEASIAKLAGAGMIWRVVDRVMQIHGGMGYTKEMPIERMMRDVRVYRIYEGTDEIQRRSIARWRCTRSPPSAGSLPPPIRCRRLGSSRCSSATLGRSTWSRSLNSSTTRSRRHARHR